MRIAGINIPDEKRTEIALTYVYGVGRSVSQKVLKQANVDGNKRAKDLTPEEVNRLKVVLDKNYTIEGELRRDRRQDVKRLIDTKTYRGTRHLKKLPARGQRTKTNSRTVRGNVRKTVGSGKRKVALK